jgi:hypothetical protein
MTKDDLVKARLCDCVLLVASGFVQVVICGGRA